MATPTPIAQLPALQSPQLLPPGSPATISLPTNVYVRPGPPSNQGTLFTFQPTPAVVPGSTLIPDAQYVMNKNGATIANQPIIYFARVLISSNSIPVSFYLPYQNNRTNASGFMQDPIYAIGGRIRDPSGYEYGYLTQILVLFT